MFNELIDSGANLVILVIGIIVVGIAFGALFLISDQIVQNSGNTNLQNTYQTGKQMINSASDFKDSSDLTNAVQNLGK